MDAHTPAFAAWFIGGTMIFAAACLLNFEADTRRGTSARWMYVVSAALFLAFFVAAVVMVPIDRLLSFSPFLCFTAFFFAAAVCKARKGERLKKFGNILMLIMPRRQMKREDTLKMFHPRHWLPVYQPLVLYRAGAISRADVAAALLATLCLVAACRHDALPIILCAAYFMAFSLDFADAESPAHIQLKRIAAAFVGFVLVCPVLFLSWLNRGNVESLAACMACALFFLIRIARERTVLLGTLRGAKTWRWIADAILCVASFVAFVLGDMFFSLSACRCTPAFREIRSGEFLIILCCLFFYPLRKLVFFLLFHNIDLFWRDLRAWRAAYLRARTSWLLEWMMAALAPAPLLRFLSFHASPDKLERAGANASLLLAIFLLLPLAQRLWQKGRHT